MTKKQIIKRCRELRRNSTEAEKLFWYEVRNRKINQLKFLRQFPIIQCTINFELKYFIADFYCSAKRIVIELDGGIHESQKEYDENRDELIKNLGIKVIRFENQEIVKAIEFVKNL